MTGNPRGVGTGPYTDESLPSGGCERIGRTVGDGAYAGEPQLSGDGRSEGRSPAVRPSGHGRILATTGALEILRWGNRWVPALCPFSHGLCDVQCPHLDDGGSTASALIRLTCGGSVRILDGTPPQVVR